jgi:hypothetical protein
MRKIYSIMMIALVGIALSCADEALDPLLTKNVSKGNLLALRGTALQNVYFAGTPAAEVFPRIINGTETFKFDAEYLSSDFTSLQSFDIYVTKRTGSGASLKTERILLTNIPFSSFKQDGTYPGPWVSVTLKLTDILAKLGLDYTKAADVTTLLTTYKFGISITSDLNLTDGSKAPAANLVAPGLFQSDQFYPAQILTYTVTDYCVYDNSTWAGTYTANEIYSNSAYGPYNVKFTQDATDKNKFFLNNFWDEGSPAYIVFTPSTSPTTQIVKFPDQTSDRGAIKSTTGTYDQCTNTLKIQTQYAGSDWRYEFVKQ